MKDRIVAQYFILVFVSLCMTSCYSQITFSRTWVRGKYPGDDLTADQADESNPAFLRAAKAGTYSGLRNEGIEMYPRSPKSQLNYNSRFLQDLMRSWKVSNLNRYKQLNMPIQEDRDPSPSLQ